MFLRPVPGMLAFLAFWLTGRDAPAQTLVSISSGDWVGELRLWEYDPIPRWRTVRVPVYVMLGELDRSVPSAETASMLRAALAQAGAKDATVRVFKRANHGLLLARTGYARETTSLAYYVPGFQDGLVSWIRQRVR